MAGRPKQVRADIVALKAIYSVSSEFVDIKPVIAYVMRYSGCTYAEIGEVIGITKQAAQALFKVADTKL